MLILLILKIKKLLFQQLKKIEYGIFMDSGPLHVAKMFNKKGLLIETSVSSKILLRNYKMIKGIENTFSSHFCKAPCGLTDIFNHNNNMVVLIVYKLKKQNSKEIIIKI